MTIIEKIAEFKIRIDTGVGTFNWLKTLILMTAATKYIISLNLTATIILGIILFIGLYVVGWIVLDKIRLVQIESALRDGKYNYFFKSLGEKVDRKI